MNFKKATILFAIIFLITGCNQAIKQDQATTNTAKSTPQMHRGLPDFGQPERKADLMGIVKSVVGNEVSILEIEMPNRKDMQKMQDKTDREANSDSDKTKTSGMSMGMRGGGMGRMGGTPPNEEQQDAMLEMLKSRSITESKVIVPVGIQMLKPETDATTEEITTLEANISDLKTDQMLSIWLNTEVTDQQIAEFVLIK